MEMQILSVLSQSESSQHTVCSEKPHWISFIGLTSGLLHNVCVLQLYFLGREL